jgi:ribosome recycling factor
VQALLPARHRLFEAIMLDDIENDLLLSFDKAITALSRDLVRIRTGRATASILDDIKLDYYGQMTPLTQIATVKVPEPRMITVQPWEKGVLGQIERAIHQSDLGLTPTNDGTMIRLPIPPLTGERRNDLAKQARKLGEDAKIIIRNARRDANELIKQLQKDSELSEDDARRATAKVQELTDKGVAKVDDAVSKKEKEIAEV